MAMKQSKVIINCAVTGAIHIPTMTPYLPITPQEIADDAVKASEAGAAIVHIHVRDPETGKPKQDIGLFREICGKIYKRSDVVICPTTGGGLYMTPEERVKTVIELEPELASMNMGSFNFALFPIVERYSDYKFDWEKPYLQNTKNFVFTNTFESMEIFLKNFQEHGTKPEMECYDMAHLYNAAYFVDKKLIEPPFYLQLILGIMGGIQVSVENFVHMKNTADKLFGDDYAFSVLPVGRHQFSLGTVSAVMGGNVRVGMEDNLYLKKGVLVKSNEDSVSLMHRVLEELSMEVATPSEARKLLQLKGKSQTSFSS